MIYLCITFVVYAHVGLIVKTSTVHWRSSNRRDAFACQCLDACTCDSCTPAVDVAARPHDCRPSDVGVRTSAADADSASLLVLAAAPDCERRPECLTPSVTMANSATPTSFVAATDYCRTLSVDCRTGTLNRLCCTGDCDGLGQPSDSDFPSCFVIYVRSNWRWARCSCHKRLQWADDREFPTRKCPDPFV